MDVKRKLGERIKELRELLEVSQKDLSFKADLDRSYIASIESGHRNVSIINIEKIAIALGITMKEFFNNEKFENTTTD